MSPRQIDRFFRLLAQDYGAGARVILTGAAAGALWGHVRASLDIDFAIQPTNRTPEHWARLEQAIDRTVRRTGITVNYAEDIDRWSFISLLDYRRHTHVYRRFGMVQVRLLDPAYWSIGKISRYLEPDVQDMIEVFKRRHVSSTRVLRIWSQALRESPRSLAVIQCVRQAEHFVRTHGVKIWGRRFNPEAAIRSLHRASRRR